MTRQVRHRRGIPGSWWRDLQFLGGRTLRQPEWPCLSLVWISSMHGKEVVKDISMTVLSNTTVGFDQMGFDLLGVLTMDFGQTGFDQLSFNHLGVSINHFQWVSMTSRSVQTNRGLDRTRASANRTTHSGPEYGRLGTPD